MAKRCSWCNAHIGDDDQFWFHNIQVGDKQKKSKEKFCSPKCSYEYPHETTPEEEGCFVATAVYGNYDHPVVLDLRCFRDDFLEQKKWGRSFIKWYYDRSPFWAAIIRGSRVLRVMAFLLLVKPIHLLVKLVTKKSEPFSTRLK